MTDDTLEARIEALQDEIDQDDAVIHSMIEEIEALESLLSPEAQGLVEDLRPLTVTDNVYEEMDEEATFGDRLSDRIAATAGSWYFIIGFLLFMMLWVSVNIIMQIRAFDPYPFILLNLALSSLAALQAPVILMSQNRQSAKDRAVAHNDYKVNLKSEIEIADLHRKMDALTEIIHAQAEMIHMLANK